MGCNSVLRSARTAIAGIQVLFAELPAATGKAGHPTERRGHLAAFGDARTGRLAADRRGDALVAGAAPIDAVDLGVGGGGLRPPPRGPSLIVSCTRLHQSKRAQRE